MCVCLRECKGILVGGTKKSSYSVPSVQSVPVFLCNDIEKVARIVAYANALVCQHRYYVNYKCCNFQ